MEYIIIFNVDFFMHQEKDVSGENSNFVFQRSDKYIKTSYFIKKLNDASFEFYFI